MSALQNANGPASAATDPDHGSNTPRKEMIVNAMTHSIAATSLQGLITSARKTYAAFGKAADRDADDEILRKLNARGARLVDEIVRFPALDLADVQAKAGYLLELVESGDDPLDPECLVPLLQSLTGAPA